MGKGPPRWLFRLKRTTRSRPWRNKRGKRFFWESERKHLEADLNLARWVSWAKLRGVGGREGLSGPADTGRITQSPCRVVQDPLAWRVGLRTVSASSWCSCQVTQASTGGPVRSLLSLRTFGLCYGGSCQGTRWLPVWWGQPPAGLPTLSQATGTHPTPGCYLGSWHSGKGGGLATPRGQQSPKLLTAHHKFPWWTQSRQKAFNNLRPFK